MPIARRTRKPSGASSTLEQLKTLVTSLIKENQKIKRQLTRLEAKTSPAAGNTAVVGLRTLARRVERALGRTQTAKRGSRRASTTATGRSHSSGTTQSKSRKATTTRKPASAETQAKRLAALARAREARAAKKATTP